MATNSASKVVSPRDRSRGATKQAAKAPRVFGVHIGLNSVDPKHYQGWDGKLAACVNDARAMQAISAQAGAKGASQSFLLLDAQATSKNFISTIATLSRQAVAGDQVFLSYSGHGGSVPDISKDETDGKDETWCLYDRQILDDELFALFATFAAGVTIIVCSDSCHSGTATKAAMVGGVAQLPPGVRAMPSEVANLTYLANRAMYDDISSHVSTVAARAVADGERAGGVGGNAADTTTNASVLLISGCQDNQFSQDGQHNGLFTGTLLDVFRGGRFTGNYEQLHRAIVKSMPPYQTPNLYVYGRWSQNARYLPAFRLPA